MSRDQPWRWWKMAAPSSDTPKLRETMATIHDRRILCTLGTDKIDGRAPKDMAAYGTCPPTCSATDSVPLRSVSNGPDDWMRTIWPRSRLVSKCAPVEISTIAFPANTSERADWIRRPDGSHRRHPFRHRSVLSSMQCPARIYRWLHVPWAGRPCSKWLPISAAKCHRIWPALLGSPHTLASLRELQWDFHGCWGHSWWVEFLWWDHGTFSRPPWGDPICGRTSLAAVWCKSERLCRVDMLLRPMILDAAAPATFCESKRKKRTANQSHEHSHRILNEFCDRKKLISIFASTWFGLGWREMNQAPIRGPTTRVLRNSQKRRWLLAGAVCGLLLTFTTIQMFRIIAFAAGITIFSLSFSCVLEYNARFITQFELVPNSVPERRLWAALLRKILKSPFCTGLLCGHLIGSYLIIVIWIKFNDGK